MNEYEDRTVVPDQPADRTAELLNAWVEGVQDYAIFLLDVTGRITSWNDGAERILGYTEAEIIGQPLAKFFTQVDAASGVPDLELGIALSRGRASDDRWHERKNGSLFWCSGILTRLGNPETGVRGFVKVMRDLTREKQVEEQLREKTEELIEADRRKNEFLAMLSHELRNPLSPIITSIYVIKDRLTGDDPIVGQSWAVIERQFLHLKKLLDGLVDISRIALNKIDLNKERVDFGDTVRRAVEDVTTQVDRNQHKLISVIETGPLVVEGDRDRLGQVVLSLLNNALKFTDPGGRIEVSAREEAGEAVLRVIDTGIGIAPDMLDQIFDLFSQAEQGLARTRGGLGIGLTLARRLVDLHGGTLTCRSRGLGEGSEFEMRLPIAADLQVGETLDANDSIIGTPLGSLKILLVDDNSDAAESMRVYLRHASHHVDVAHDGQAAIDRSRELQPDVVVLDIGLPRIDGYEVASQIRRETDIPLIALSGYAKDESRDVQFDYYLVKPIRPSDLLAILSRLRPRTKPGS